MPGWRLSKADGSDLRTDLSLAQVRELLAGGAYGANDLVASPKQKVMLPIGSVAALEKFLPQETRDERAETSPPVQPPAKARPGVVRKPVPEPVAPTKAPQPVLDIETPRAPAGTAAATLAGAGVYRRRLQPVEEDTDIDISAMIDVVFQLLIFFMVCSVLQPSSAVNVPQTETGQGLDPERCMVVAVASASPDEPADGGVTYFLESQPEAKLSLTEVAQRAAERAEQDGSQAIILKAAKDAPYEAVRDLLIELRKHTEISVRTGVKEKR